MENLAYLHLAFAYEDHETYELVSWEDLFNPSVVPDWKRLSSKAWKYMLPLALTISLLGTVSHVFALERGDQVSSVRNLQQRLKTAGFYHASITQVYDLPTENAVRHFQKVAGLPVDGVIDADTLAKLKSWRTSPGIDASQSKNVSKTTNKHLTGITHPKNTTSSKIVPGQSHHSHFLKKGDEGEDVKSLQERLRTAGFYYGNATSIFGPITEEAVKRFQTAYKLKVDGVVGAATLAKLPPVAVGNPENSPKKVVNRDKFHLGDRGEAVRVLQEHLIEAGYLKGQPNGYYGSNTADAVTRFQKAHQLEANGIAGSSTRGKLYSLVNNNSEGEFTTLEIQRRLQERGFYKGQLNGMMANDTKKAIKRAQEFYGISLSDIKRGNF